MQAKDVKEMAEIKLHQNSDAPNWEHWLDIEAFSINRSPWPVGSYRPRSEARLLVHNGSLHVRLATYEPDPDYRRAKCRETGGPVHLDSCIEAFISFSDEDDEPYFNFEFNSLGTPHIALGMGRGNRRVLPASELAALRINCMLDINPDGEFEEGWWQIHFQVPETWLFTRLGHEVKLEEGQVIRANFYKCGDETLDPHYLSWADIGTAEPDFHQPEYFRKLKVVQ